MVGQYLRDQDSVSPLGWACVVTAPQPSRTFMLMPIAVVEVDMQACVHVGWVGVMHGHLTPPPNKAEVSPRSVHHVIRKAAPREIKVNHPHIRASG